MATTQHPIHTSGGAATSGDQTGGEPKLVLTVTEAAEVLGISRGLAYELARTGVIPAIRFGRRLVVPRARLQALLSDPAGTLC